MRKIAGGFRPRSIGMEADTRWRQYVFNQELEFETKVLEETTKRLWIESGGKLVGEALKAAAKLAVAAM